MEARIDEGQVRHIAHLARLKLSDREISRYAGQLAAILGYVKKLEEVDTDGVEPTAHPLPVCNVFGEDRPQEPYRADAALLNAPARQDNFFKVPKVLEDGGGA